MNRTGIWKAMCGAVVLALVLVFVGADISAQEEQGTGASSEELPESLKGLIIKDRFIPAAREKVGEVYDLEGSIVIIHYNSGKGYFGKEGDVIYEKDSLYTLRESRCRIRFFNEDVVSMAEESRFSVDSYKDERAQGKKTSFFSMLKGKIKFYAMKLLKYRTMEMKVKTPTAVVGVRGTSFFVHVYRKEGEKVSHATVQILDRRQRREGAPPDAGTQGAEGTVLTDVLCDEGKLVVTDSEGRRVISKGQMFSQDTGEVLPIPENLLEQFNNATGGGNSDGGGDVEWDGTDEREKGTTSILEEDAEQMEEQTDTSGTETGTNGDITGITGEDILAASCLIYYDYAGEYYIYQSEEASLSGGGGYNLTDLNHSPLNDQYRLTLEGASSLEVSYFAHGGGDIHTPSPFTWQEEGRYGDYLSWGWWEHPPSGEVGDDGMGTYEAVQSGIWGMKARQTHQDSIDYLQGQGRSYHYTGGARGVYGDTSFTTAILSGDFSCDVDFGSRTVSGFQIYATGGGHTVDLNNGSGAIDSEGGFDISFSDGTINGNNVVPSETEASGGFAGPEAEAVGALWHAVDGTGSYATGECHGER